MLTCMFIYVYVDENGRCVEEKSAFITNIPEGESVLKTLQFSGRYTL